LESQANPGANNSFLTPNGFSKSPRRVVDVDENIYIIGHRYYCRVCRKSYQSWSPALLAALPPALAMQFTYHLTYHSGLTDRVVSLMRGCFLQGVGPVPFSKMIQMNHIRHYEQHHLWYLETIYARSFLPLAFMGNFEPFSTFNDRNGYAGYTPSPRYFRDFYVRYVNSYAEEIDQYTAMLSGKYIQIDHSFKVRLDNICQDYFIYFLFRYQNILES
jgi:hypothetical protein